MADRDPEGLAIYIVLLVTMAPVVVVTWATSASFGGGAGLALAVALVGLFGILAQLRRSTDFPRARLRRSRPRRTR